MAYAEKRGNGPAPWRARYKLPDGSWGSEPGFENESAAINWGNEQEADIRRGRWVDRRVGDITLAEWDTEWWPSLELAIKSRTNYRGSIDKHILPAFGNRPLNTLDSPNEIDVWEKGIRQSSGPEAAKAARARLITMLGDAVIDGRMTTNPAVRQRKRGRKRKPAKVEKKVWAEPLQVLLHAERSALLTGWEGDFIMPLFVAYTGVRYGETIGLEPAYVHPGVVQIDWQLVEDSGRFYRTPPKNNSRRRLDIPPFLDDLLNRLKKSTADHECSHAAWEAREDAEDDEEPCPSGVRYLWLGERGGHPRNSNYIRRVFDPACEGFYPKDARGRGPERPVLVDLAAGWPGKPIRPTRWRPVPEASEAESWPPLVPGLTPHGLRHSHEVWIDEDKTPEVLQHERLGHEMEGIRAVYRHVSDGMRAELRSALQLRWELALMRRAELDPHSPLAVLDELLRPCRREAGGGAGSGSPKSLPTTAKAAPR